MEGGGGAAEAKRACVCIYWLMNQYGFSSTERPDCNGEYLSLPPGASARSPLIALPLDDEQAGVGG